MQTTAEIPVARATGDVAAIYRAMMAASGTGTPALIFRHFATHPGFLEWAWAAVGPEIESGQVRVRAEAALARTEVPELPPLSAADLAAAGIGDGERPMLDAILTSYNRMNPMNLALIAAIAGLIGPEAEGDRAQEADLPPPVPPPDPCPELPAPVDPAAMAPDLAAMMARLSDGLPQSGPRLVPTLYRHLAIWPDLMRRLGPPILAALDDGRVAEATARFEAGIAPLTGTVLARARARAPGPAPLADPAAMGRTLETFLAAIPQMSVIGKSVGAALATGSPRA